MYAIRKLRRGFPDSRCRPRRGRWYYHDDFWDARRFDFRILRRGRCHTNRVKCFRRRSRRFDRRRLWDNRRNRRIIGGYNDKWKHWKQFVQSEWRRIWFGSTRRFWFAYVCSWRNRNIPWRRGRRRQYEHQYPTYLWARSRRRGYCHGNIQHGGCFHKSSRYPLLPMKTEHITLATGLAILIAIVGGIVNF